jgi:hypothetical protein
VPVTKLPCEKTGTIKVPLEETSVKVIVVSAGIEENEKRSELTACSTPSKGDGPMPL